MGYTFAAMALKRAMDGGHPWRVLFIVNLIGAVLFQTWLLHGGAPFTVTNITHAVTLITTINCVPTIWVTRTCII